MKCCVKGNGAELLCTTNLPVIPVSSFAFIPRAGISMGGPHTYQANLTSARKHVRSASSESFSLAICVLSPLFHASYNTVYVWLPLLPEAC